MSEEGERYLGLELQGVKKRVSRMENGRASLERSVHENSGKLGVVNDETFGIWAERLNYLSDLQESLDRKTLPKMGSELADLEKRLTRLEAKMKVVLAELSGGDDE